jgi:N-acetylmuramoyl-L-alanine amidase
MSNLIEIQFDAGHGGNDPGAVGHGLHEADVVLDLCLKTGDFIMDNYSNVKVTYSRSNDTYLTLGQRTDIANLRNVDFFYSFHNNSFGKESANGFETFIYPSAGKETQDIQNVIHNEIMSFLKQYGITDRGKKKGNLHVVRETKMPAVLTEYLFISNKKENDLLRNTAFIQALAEVTAKGIAKALRLKEKVKPKPVPKPVAKPSRKLYKVQLGAFEVKENAEKLAKEAKLKGFTTYIVEE